MKEGADRQPKRSACDRPCHNLTQDSLNQLGETVERDACPCRAVDLDSLHGNWPIAAKRPHASVEPAGDISQHRLDRIRWSTPARS